MTDDELRALGLGTMYERLHAVEIHARENERRLIRQRRIIKQLTDIIMVETIAVMAYGVVTGCLIGNFICSVLDQWGVLP